MNAKKLVALCVVAVVLVALAVVASKRRSGPPPADSAAKLLPGLAVNEVATLRIVSATATATVSRAGDTWAVAEKHGYPASFDRLYRLVTKLAELKPGQVVRVDRSQWADLQLLSPLDPAGANRDAMATRLELLDAGGKLLASLDLGKSHMRTSAEMPMYGGYPDGRYIATANGTVQLVADSLDDVTATVRDWIDDSFLQVSASDLVALDVTGGTNPPVTLAREGDAPLALPAVPAGREPDATKLDRLSGALSYLRFEDVADPALTPEQTGLAAPLTYRARAKDGRIYTVQLGGSPAGSDQRYAAVRVGFEAPPASTNAPAADKPSPEEEAKALQDKLGKWVYLLSSYSAESMTLPLAELTKEKLAETNAPAADAAPVAPPPAP